MAKQSPYKEFTKRLSLLVEDNAELMTMTLSNIFTMRLIGNKTHGDLAEIAIAEFINQYMYDFSAEHVGKAKYRAKSEEEDIKIHNKVTKDFINVSLKAFGHGPIQLSTDKTSNMFARLEAEKSSVISNKQKITKIFNDPAFATFSKINVLLLIYDEGQKQCNILVFDYPKAKTNTTSIEKVKSGSGRKYPIFKFLDKRQNYICEVRYGGVDANALQRGLWTNTKKASTNYFSSLTNGWVSYSHNLDLVKLISYALVSSNSGHKKALAELVKDIKRIIKGGKIN